MVSGRHSRRLAVIDLDGTLVRGNTLHEYIRLGLSESFRRGRLLSSLKIAAAIVLRRFRLISHPAFKFSSLDCIRPSDRLKNRFQSRIRGMINPEVETLIGEFRSQGIAVILATAAPACYVPWIWSGDYLATCGRDELRGIRKLEAVRKYMERSGLELYAVVTDHEDDLPLLHAGAPVNLIIRGEKIKKFSGS